MAVMGFVTVDTPYLVLAVSMVLQAAGMSIVAAPATGGIMSAVPMSKAGVGSAVNDTTRELGGALGIAVFGSLVNSIYRANIDLGGLDLPPSAAEAARSPSARPQARRRRSAGTEGPPSSSERPAPSPKPSTWHRLVSVAIAVAAAGLVAHTFTRAKEQRGVRGSAELELVAAAPAAE